MKMKNYCNCVWPEAVFKYKHIQELEMTIGVLGHGKSWYERLLRDRRWAIV